jgi:hypothetical protein
MGNTASKSPQFVVAATAVKKRKAPSPALSSAASTAGDNK